MKKRIIPSLLLVVALMFSLTLSCFASSNNTEIHDINITVNLHEDGSADISETWSITAKGITEWYLVKDDLNDIKLSDFNVREGDNQFAKIDNWDIHASIDAKKNKCGIVAKDDGKYELCWGIGSEGFHEFTTSYKMTNFLKAYSDKDGFNQRFYKSGFSSSPEHVKVTILSDNIKFNDDNSDIWSFGFIGNINFKDNKIIAESDGDINSVIVLVGFNKDIFKPTSVVTNMTFDELRQEAFRGGDYKEKDELQKKSSSFPMITIVGVLALASMLLSRTLSINFKKKLYNLDKQAIKNVNWCRDIPYNGDINTTFHVLDNVFYSKNDRKFKESNIISAYLLRWIQQGKIKVTKTPAKKFLGLGEEMQTSIILNTNPASFVDNKVESELYEILYQAAGRDNILQEKELYNYSKSNYDRIESFMTMVNFEGKSVLRQSEDIFFDKKGVAVFTKKGTDRALNMFGFKKYLNDFTIINEREAIEVNLWDNYLVFASLYGIADKVSAEFKNIKPDFFEATPDMSYSIYDQILMINLISYSCSSGFDAGRSAAEIKTASAGGGGFSSFGGGGGCSGGGFAGGR